MLRAAIYIFYSYWLITGGYRNFSEELYMRNYIESLGISDPVMLLVDFTEKIGIVLLLFILCFPLKKYLHLAFFCLFFPLSTVFQNLLFLEKYLIVIDCIPLVFFFFLHYSSKEEQTRRLKQFIVKLICVGYMSSLISKTSVYWLDPGFLATQTIVHNFEFFFDKTYFSSLFLHISNPFMYKLCDYSILMLQGFSFIVFFYPALFKAYSRFLVVFHTLVFLIFNFYFFFPYILLYTLLISNNQYKLPATPLFRRVLFALAIFLFGLFIFSGFDIFFIIKFFGLSSDFIGKTYFIITVLIYIFLKNNYLYTLISRRLLPFIKKIKQ